MKDFRIKTITVGNMSENCYLIFRENQKSKECSGVNLYPGVLIDPGADSEIIAKTCEDLGVFPQAILLTHGHFDHIGAVQNIKQTFPDIKVYAAEKEMGLLKDANINLSAYFGISNTVNADIYVKEGDVLSIAEIDWEVIETPGHTSGSVCYWIREEGVLISGDTLFAGSIGRTDFPTGNYNIMKQTLIQKINKLPDDVMVYPGHGNPTTIGYEKEHNPEIQSLIHTGGKD